MCERDGLMLAAMLAGVPIAAEEAGRLAAQLGEPREVLPHLLLLRGGFADWPATRAAFSQASRAVIRPRVLAPQAAGAGALPAVREGCRAAGLRLLAPGDVEDNWAADTMIALRPRLSRRPQPNDFIATS
ncbi:hypothetical protein [Erythrobacter sp. BLCC-B19]|uniref:hypothetical protein n=1 Tax=Erythrobacter sp. BLCC-B19 TaxID=3025315 RepID=UPI00235F458E|nr:hypothetical protein [Erythrobacter sp. BLCC-B19]WDA41809.1 hypothetical protein PS060_03105 [Erythrobacter sp. BLCC-B19]